ncbi:ATP-binding protein [uncultured Draconibacterium sp.]|uniref:PAS domain-containing hybrid sensor histidine kinase/response regulator n=1 Tax=uncultured Draconibacterium sp. TaxID=1573823 RepID=UPI003217E0D5
MDNLKPQEILDALQTEYFVVDLKSKKIIQTNSPGIEKGSSCFKAIFNNDTPCGLKDGKCLCQQLSSKNRSYNFVHTIDKAGKTIRYKAVGKLIKKDVGLLSCNNITKDFEQQNEIENSAKRLEEVEKLANFGYWEMDLNTSVITPSLGSRIIYGIKNKRTTLSEIREFTLPQYRKLFDKKTNDLIRKGFSFDIEYKIKRPSDSQVRHIHAIAEFRKDKNIGYGIIVDITEASEAKNALVENKEYLKLLFKNMNSAFAQHKIVTNDLGEPVDYVFLDVNQKFEELTGLKKEDILNKTVREVIPTIEELWIKRYGKVALTGEPIVFTDFSQEIGKYFEVAAFSPWKNFFAVSFTDVTNRKRAEMELLAAKEKAVESDQLKTLFLANMSHEIRTPLNGILGFSNLLANNDVEDGQREYYGKIIENSGHRLMTVIDDIVNISMIQSNQLNIDNTEFDLVDLLEEIYHVYQKQYQEKLNELEFKLELSGIKGMLAVYSDKDRVFQIVKNLLDNAFKFTSEGAIEFGLKNVTDSNIELFVKDSGIGIHKDKQNVIFDSFRQAEEGQNRKYGGSGLGLAIVSGIVDKLDGSIAVSSDVGRGTEFTVILPRNEQNLRKYTFQMITPDLSESSAPDLSKTILSFEDDNFSAEFISNVAGILGYKHVNFVYPNEGLKYLRSNHVDLILMDVQLPEMSGYEVTQIIKAEFPEIPIIIQTAFVMAGDMEKAYDAGCDDYISKPITVDAFCDKINKCLKLECS